MKGLYIILENFSSTKLEKIGKYGKIFLSQKAEKGGKVSGWWERDRKMPHPVVGCGGELREVVGVEHMADEIVIDANSQVLRKRDGRDCMGCEFMLYYLQIRN